VINFLTILIFYIHVDLYIVTFISRPTVKHLVQACGIKDGWLAELQVSWCDLEMSVYAAMLFFPNSMKLQSTYKRNMPTCKMLHKNILMSAVLKISMSVQVKNCW